MSSHTEQQQRARVRAAVVGAEGYPALLPRGYAMHSLPSFTCPECGSDLREVGIDTPGAVRQLLGRITRSAGAVRGMILAVSRMLGLRVPGDDVRGDDRSAPRRPRRLRPARPPPLGQAPRRPGRAGRAPVE